MTYIRAKKFGFIVYTSQDCRIVIRQGERRRKTKKVFGRGGRHVAEKIWNVFVDGKLVARDVVKLADAKEIGEGAVGARTANPKIVVKTLKDRPASTPGFNWYDLEICVGKKRYWADALKSKDGFVSVFHVILEGGARKTPFRSGRYKEIEVAVREHLGHRQRNPWEHIGGGCKVGENLPPYPCDDDFEETATGEQINIQTSVEGHFNLPARGGEAKSVKAIMRQPGVKKGSKRQIRPPTKKGRKKNPSVTALVRKALK